MKITVTITMLIAPFLIAMSSPIAAPKLNPYSNNEIHKWACSYVFKAVPNDKSGCYDICDAYTAFGPLDDDNLTNACAIVLNGAEW